ncbi:MAG: hypothetical protein ABI723_13055 [Bacteroidia bacterium]
MELLNTQNQQISKTITNAILNSKRAFPLDLRTEYPSLIDFERTRKEIIETEYDYEYNIIYKKRTRFYFTIKVHRTKQQYQLAYSPFKMDIRTDATVWDFDGVKSNLLSWMNTVLAEIKENNFWGSFASEDDFSFETDNAELNDLNDRRFTSTELKIVIAEIQDCKKMNFEIATLTADQLQRIEESLEFLKETAENKKKNQVIEVLIGITVRTLAPLVGKDTALTLIDILKHHFATSDELNKLLH